VSTYLFCKIHQTYTKSMNTDMPTKPPSGGPTKDEILAISLFKLNLSPCDMFADLGCGTGRISREVAPLVKQVFAVDRRSEACNWTEKEAIANSISNISVFNNDNRTFLTTVDHLDSAFVGGSQGLEEVIDALAKLKVRSLVINAVMIETVNIAVSCLKKHGMFREVIMAQISRSYSIGSGIMFKPLDPVFIICGGLGC
jgi:cobalt-precorrin-6B (C15)-methyltransferase